MTDDSISLPADEGQVSAGAVPRDDSSEYIYISKALIFSLVSGFVMFLVGGVAGFFLATTAYQRGVDDTVANLQNALGGAAPAAQAQAQPTALPVRLENVSIDDDPMLGPEDAPVTIVEFSDFRCPYCKRWHDETMPEILETYGDQVRIIYRDFPVVGGEAAAEASECADEQNAYWDYHYGLFKDPQAYTDVDAFVALAGDLNLDTDAFRACLEENRYQDEITGDYNDARAYGVSGTPTFFINGVRVVGAQPFANFQAIIDEELNQ